MDEDSLRGKTVKISYLARAASIFAVERIYIYRDPFSNFDRDYDTERSILDYAETPPYLRKRLIGKKSDLEFVGLLSPLKIPHHLRSANLQIGEIREAVLVEQNNEIRADVGARELAYFEGRNSQPMRRVTVRVTTVKPLRVSPSEKPKGEYWGYEVRRAPSLGRFLRGADFDLVLLTSRLGKQVNEFWQEFVQRTKKSEKIIVCFGSPIKGIHELLKGENMKIDEIKKSLVVNSFPDQNTETVRLEEAVMGFLSILNLAKHL